MLSTLALPGCSAGPPVPVTPPQGHPSAGCARLHAALPDELADAGRRPTTPRSRRTAAWGDPPAVLRCGVARPAALRRTSQLIEVNGVDWLFVERPSAYVFTTAGRRSYVELRVPKAVPRAAATGPLAEIAQAMRTSVPPG